MQAEPASGVRLGPYRIESLLGEGAMGKVWRAVHEDLGRAVAIKALKPAAAADASLVTRFLAEARAVNLIRHENIVECEGIVQDDGGPAYVVMELLQGRTLGAAIAAEGRLAPDRAARIAVQIAAALEAAHAQGIVHRDLKPENVFLIHRAGSDDYVKVLDFGIARLRPDLGAIAATETGALVGTPAYMAPEQVRGERATPAADVYALGVVLFQMVTGRLPLTAANMPLMFVATLTHTPSRADAVAPEVPAALADLIDRALDKEPRGRPPSMEAFRAELLAAVGLGPAVVAARPAIDASLAPDALAATVMPGDVVGAAASTAPARRGRAPVVAAALGVAVLGAGGVWFATRDRGAASAPPDAAVVAELVAPDAARAPPPLDAAQPDATPPIDAGPPPDAAKKVRAPAPKDDPGPPTSGDPVHDNAVAAIRKRYVDGLHVCWEMSHKLERDLPRSAKVAISLHVGEAGGVDDFKIGKLTFDKRALEGDLDREQSVVDMVTECLERQIGVWRFPAADHAIDVDTTVTLKSKR